MGLKNFFECRFCDQKVNEEIGYCKTCGTVYPDGYSEFTIEENKKKKLYGLRRDMGDFVDDYGLYGACLRGSEKNAGGG